MYSVPPQCVLAATDLSEHGGEAADRAVALATAHGARVRVVHVLSPGVDPDLVEFAGARLRSRTRRYADGGENVETGLRFGRTGHALLDEARKTDADLLVVGAHGAHRRPDASIGGVPANLVRASGVPTLIVRRPADTAYRRVLLAVDDSEVSREAARVGTGLTPEAEHLVLHAGLVPGERLLLQQGVDDAGLEQLRSAVVEQARPGIERLADTLHPRPDRVLVVPGRAQDTVPERAESLGADLVAVGTGTRSGLGYTFLGSVARHVVVRSPCDVLVVPNAER
ncbi:universal stress protein [Streptomyces megasporus]|uniref:universal stress protein n=1 Tax=Streptomyces megasporus TaxID=44060 RepID=UPI0004E1A3C0|nr:universal stress protein [Streptomyces megasporus]